MLTTLYMVFYIYALFGMHAFSGLITESSAQVYNPGIPTLYYLINFNDFATSMVTLFANMVVNNWWVMCTIFTDVTGSLWPRFYFISFFFIVDLVLINLVIAILLEIYSKVED